MEEKIESSEFKTVDELAEMLKVDPRTIRRIVERKEISAVRIGRQWRFRSDWVHEWLTSNTVNRQARHSSAG